MRTTAGDSAGSAAGSGRCYSRCRSDSHQVRETHHFTYSKDALLEVTDIKLKHVNELFPKGGTQNETFEAAKKEALAHLQVW